MTLGIIIGINYTLALGFQEPRVAVGLAASLSSQIHPSFLLLCQSLLARPEWVHGPALDIGGAWTCLPSLSPLAPVVSVGESKIRP